MNEDTGYWLDYLDDDSETLAEFEDAHVLQEYEAYANAQAMATL